MEVDRDGELPVSLTLSFRPPVTALMSGTFIHLSNRSGEGEHQDGRDGEINGKLYLSPAATCCLLSFNRRFKERQQGDE